MKKYQRNIAGAKREEHEKKEHKTKTQKSVYQLVKQIRGKKAAKLRRKLKQE